jgi:phosphoglycolate phosphatase
MKYSILLTSVVVAVGLYGCYELYDYLKPINYSDDRWVIFDFDGTIAATVPTMMAVINELQTIYGYQPVKGAELESLRKVPAKELVGTRLGLAWYQLPLFQYRFRKAAKKHLPTVKLHDGVHDVIVAAKQAGCKIGVISSNSVEFITNFFRKNDVPLFDDISEASIFGKAAVIKKFMKRNGIKQQNAVYVGDETRDIEACHDAGVTSIAVSWGGNCAQLLEQYRPTELVHDAEGLQGAIQKCLVT